MKAKALREYFSHEVLVADSRLALFCSTPLPLRDLTFLPLPARVFTWI
ncbi:MAG TPA: hypothetical protein VEC99_02015 [Clostridia bacterium]|nr:hypothetical protein [Clostridia bacterium]